MPQSSYDVPVVEQGAENPICWVASMAMVESYWTQSSVGVGKYTGGFDPSMSCIDNMAADVVDFQNRMASFGFYPVYPDEPLNLNSLYEASDRLGPLIYFHYVNGFPALHGSW
ncbi:papain-like cysteine protease family protein [uncultured Arthrobacter sp.]|uniref:papain-like cysteine protease family protein n=1 Tax=uncultured Arthrobacter sp. TaxID=114050 RepID=UPI0037DCCD0E